jgi:predicted membrane-bound spermidine synthase
MDEVADRQDSGRTMRIVEFEMEKQTSSLLIYCVFTVSGFAAILYQLIWQRSLFAIYGTSIESVTVVVAAFMLGLGFGSLLGGEISKRQRSLIVIFGLFEIGIGVFGFFSLEIFRWVGSFTLRLSILQTGLSALLVLLIPTLLMGATLPLLVSEFVARSGNVGHTVGKLYFVNTLGSGVGCIVAAVVLFRHAGQGVIVTIAAILNVCVGISVLLHQYRRMMK